jgi:putative FmdB family regulatory protein
MPIYEFFCNRCNTVFSFLSRRIQPQKTPDCPRCRKGPLERVVSAFATPGRAREGGEDADLPFDESAMEAAVSDLASEAESVSEDDPRQAAALMRKFTRRSGLELGDGMREALDRMEAGEDPEKIEADLGDALENEEPLLPPGKHGVRARTARRPAPRRDPTLYDL